MMDNWLLPLASYFVIWWMALFAVLPWGVRRNQNPEIGHDPGAPLEPRLKSKFLATTILAAVIWAIGYVLIKQGWMEIVIQWMWKDVI